jgi:hypothetical protein
MSDLRPRPAQYYVDNYSPEALAELMLRERDSRSALDDQLRIEKSAHAKTRRVLAERAGEIGTLHRHNRALRDELARRAGEIEVLCKQKRELQDRSETHTYQRGPVTDSTDALAERVGDVDKSAGPFCSAMLTALIRDGSVKPPLYLMTTAWGEFEGSSMRGVIEAAIEGWYAAAEEHAERARGLLRGE